MARKITPLKYVGPKASGSNNKKSSPAKAFLNLWGGKGDYGRSEMESEFSTLKGNIEGIDVTKNFYQDLANPYAGLDDPYASLQNVAEDLTVDQKKFEQQERTLQQGLSQTLQSSKETGTQNTQAIANQLAQSSGDIAADIGAQESANQRLTAKAANELQLKKAGSKRETDMKIREGAHETKMQVIKGSEDAMSRDLNKQQALLGLVSGELARADAQAEDDEGWLA